jgi:alkanesulfonate monooxygenase SsuD/methylene tetrahydromethanopterin reductase-like flavin-dependent oxidoreductase (luciferase family)
VPREILPLTGGRVSVGSHDNPDKADADQMNREVMEESLDLLLLSLREERFCHRGTHFQVPPTGIPDRGGEVEDLTLVPRPRDPFEVWQPVNSAPTLAAAAARGFTGVFWLLHDELLRARWESYGEAWEQAHGTPLGRGAQRALVVGVRVEDTNELAVESARPGHDEFWKFLGPYGWSRGYRLADGSSAPPGMQPSLEDSMAQRTWIIGSPDSVAEQLAALRDELGVEDLILFPHLPGDSYKTTEEQLERVAGEVLPQL